MKKTIQKDNDSAQKTDNPKLTAIVLAGGQGTRMKSPLPKVLHPVAGRPMIDRVIRAVKQAGSSEIRLVVGHGQGLVRAIVGSLGVICFEQKEQLGTAHAVRAAQVETIEGNVLILNGDHPLIEGTDFQEFIKFFQDEKLDLCLVTAVVKKPADLGRVVRHRGDLKAIVEVKDASADTLKIHEVNTGIYLIKGEVLKELLPKIKNHNLKKEYYLTDLLSLAIEEGYKVQALAGKAHVAVGVNTQADLARATRQIFSKKIKELMDEGVMVLDPKCTYVEDSVSVGPGSVIYPQAFLRGNTKIGSYSVIEPHVFISDCTIGDSVQIRAGSYLEKSKVHNKCVVGPYARLRPDSEIFEEAHIGNFVELKNAKFGKKSKAAHLAYVGDAEVGEDCNIGCGTIFVNYLPNKEKHRTKIGNRVFVGSDVQLIAPLEIGDDSVLGAGSVITKNVPSGALAVTRAKQVIKEDYRPRETEDLVESSENSKT
jgi:bifunctional UDP-N-acetylglucosamine pyrophosphorylase/glucosamine-1-phosphate N-acetyltransferase